MSGYRKKEHAASLAGGLARGLSEKFGLQFASLDSNAVVALQDGRRLSGLRNQTFAVGVVDFSKIIGNATRVEKIPHEVQRAESSARLAQAILHGAAPEPLVDKIIEPPHAPPRVSLVLEGADRRVRIDAVPFGVLKWRTPTRWKLEVRAKGSPKFVQDVEQHLAEEHGVLPAEIRRAVQLRRL